MKLLLDANGNVVLRNGKPVYVHDDGTEVEFDAPAAVSKITALNNEAKGHRLEAKEAKEKLASFDGIEDAEVARKALETVKNLDQKKLIDAGEVEKVKKEVATVYEGRLAEKDKVISEKDGYIYKLEVSNRFTASPFIAEKTTLPPDLAEAYFGKHFKVEDGKTVAYIGDDKVYSRKNPGELAEFEEAIEQIVDKYPMKDRILKGKTGSGSDTRQRGQDTRTGDKDNLTPVQKIAAGLREAGAGA